MKYFMVLALFCAGCASVQKKSVGINRGSSKDQVVDLMGHPENRQLLKTKEIWQYCDTGFNTHNYTAILFKDDVVEKIVTYGRSPAMGFCDNSFQTFLDEAKPDQTIELRQR